MGPRILPVLTAASIWILPVVSNRRLTCSVPTYVRHTQGDSALPIARRSCRPQLPAEEQPKTESFHVFRCLDERVGGMSILVAFQEQFGPYNSLLIDHYSAWIGN